VTPLLAITCVALLLASNPCIAGSGEPAPRGERSAPDTCNGKPSAPAWLDRMQAGLYRTTCLAAARFDGLFGNERFDTEYEATSGRVATGAIWSERDQFADRSRFRVHMRLPQLSGRLGVFIGQDDADEPADRQEDAGTLRRPFGAAHDEQVLIGLGYRQPAFGGGIFDTSLGSHFRSGLDPYIRGRYRVALPFLERNVARLSEILFWQDGLGAGGTSRLDVDRLLAQGFLARWTGSVTLATHTQGVRWFTGATLYQSLGTGRALAYQLGASGESRADVPVSDYGLQLVFRRRVLRDWLFLELSSGISWPREFLHEDRERNLACGVSMEMWFGDAGFPGG
jgi:hypothetical protein